MVMDKQYDLIRINRNEKIWSDSEMKIFLYTFQAYTYSIMYYMHWMPEQFLTEVA